VIEFINVAEETFQSERTNDVSKVKDKDWTPCHPCYDASYLAIADVEGITMITSDEGLYNTIKKDLKWVKWLGDL
jgi:predicted nucleic acid-binding protein